MRLFGFDKKNRKSQFDKAVEFFYNINDYSRTFQLLSIVAR